MGSSRESIGWGPTLMEWYCDVPAAIFLAAVFYFDGSVFRLDSCLANGMSWYEL